MIEKRSADTKIAAPDGEVFRIVAEECPNMIFVNKNGRVVYANKKCVEIMGYTREEILSPEFDFMSLIDDESREVVARALEQHQLGRDVPPFEYRLVTRSGSRLDVLITTKLITYDGEAAILGIVTDISGQKQAETALRASEERYRTTIDSLADAIHVVDKDLRIVLINEALRQMNRELGLPADIEGRKIFDAFPFLQSVVRDEYNRVLKSQRVLITREMYEVRGRQVFTETRKIPIIENGGVVKIVTAIRNISDARAKEEELQELNRELSDSNKKLKILSLTDSHTGLFNHRFLGEVIENEFQHAKKKKQALSLVMLDIDYFKSINDVYGHDFGDRVLKQFARSLKATVGKETTVIRYGGEEFVILLPAVSRTDAIALSQKLLEKTGLAAFGDRGKRVKLKLSVAVASCPEDGPRKAMDLIELAEQILFRAKETGGNRVYSLQDIRNLKRYVVRKDGVRSEVRFLKEKIGRLHKSANQSLMEAIFAFARTIELKDHYTGEHVERTVYFATRIAEAMGLTKEEVMLIKQAAVLHDLGKVGISEKILLKPAKLSRKEFTEIRKHPLIGVDIIRPIHFFHDIIPLIMYHHERWDGKGYPTGLKGDEIPLGARIISLADTYQALISNRPYRKAYSRKEAKKIIRMVSGSQFDPKIVEAFLKIA